MSEILRVPRLGACGDMFSNNMFSTTLHGIHRAEVWSTRGGTCNLGGKWSVPPFHRAQNTDQKCMIVEFYGVFYSIQTVIQLLYTLFSILQAISI